MCHENRRFSFIVHCFYLLLLLSYNQVASTFLMSMCTSRMIIVERELQKVFVSLIFRRILMLLLQITDSLRMYSWLNVYIMSSSSFAVFDGPEKLIMVILRHDLDTFFFTYCKISTFCEFCSLNSTSAQFSRHFCKPLSNLISLSTDLIVVLITAALFLIYGMY